MLKKFKEKNLKGDNYTEVSIFGGVTPAFATYNGIERSDASKERPIDMLINH